MWKKIRESLPWLIVGLIALVYGAYNFIRLAVMPHIQRFVQR